MAPQPLVIDPGRVAAALACCAHELIGRRTVDAVLAELTEHTAAAFAAYGAGVMLLDKQGRLEPAAASDAFVQQLNLIEVHSAEGPSLVVVKFGDVVDVPDLEHESRWPTFTQSALRSGLRAMISVPLEVEGRCWGTLVIYHDRPTLYTGDVLDAARMVTSAVATLVHNADEYERATGLSQQLQQALDTRLVIEQAKGKLAGVLGISIGEAFHRLRTYARSRQRKVRDVAGEIVTGVLEAEEFGSD